MKSMWAVCMALLAMDLVWAEAKVENSLKNLKKSAKSEKLQIENLDSYDFHHNNNKLLEGSGGGDEEYYYEDDDDYFYKDLEHEKHLEGSGDDQDHFGGSEGIKVVLETEKSTSTVKTLTNDFHFEDDFTSKNGKEDKQDELLYEYYNEYYEEEEEDYSDLDKDIEKLDNEEEKLLDVIEEIEENEEPEEKNMFKISYLYIMLASAFLSFCLAIVVFLVCKKSVLDKEEKKKQAEFVPFIVSSDFRDPKVVTKKSKKSPIVKCYTRVPTTTQEFLHSDFHHSNMKKEASQTPLLLP